MPNQHPGLGVQALPNLQTVKGKVRARGRPVERDLPADMGKHLRRGNLHLRQGRRLIEHIVILRRDQQPGALRPCRRLGRQVQVDARFHQLRRGEHRCQAAGLTIDLHALVEVIRLGRLAAHQEHLVDHAGAVFGWQQARGVTHLHLADARRNAPCFGGQVAQRILDDGMP